MIYPFIRRFGHRGSVLNGFGVVAISYGTALLVGYQPTFKSAFNVPLPFYGAMFVAVGVFALSWLATPSDRWQYGVSVAWSAFWGFLIASHFTSPYGWAAGISWYGISAALFLASAWPDAMKIPKLPKWEGLDCEPQRDSSMGESKN